MLRLSLWEWLLIRRRPPWEFSASFLTTDSDVNDAKIPVDVAATAFLGWFANVIIQKILPCDLEFFKLSLYQGTLDMMENTVAGITNSAYMNIKELWKCEKTD